MKFCKRCETVKPLADFAANKTSRDKLHGHCRDCQRLVARASFERNRERRREANRAWDAANPVKRKAMNKAWRDNNPETYRQVKAHWSAKNPDWKPDPEYMVKWRAGNKARTRVYDRLRRTATKAAQPAWANLPAMEMFYEDARIRTEWTGVPHQVDHIVPLRSKLVCGLHCEQNLQVLTQPENARKGNRTWPDMP